MDATVELHEKERKGEKERWGEGNIAMLKFCTVRSNHYFLSLELQHDTRPPNLLPSTPTVVVVTHVQYYL